MRESVAKYCIRSGRQDLLIQWNSAKNGELSPEDITFGSQKMVWWRCAQGHEWQSPPYARIGKEAGCPFCAGKRLSQEIVLSTVYPELAEQWHPGKNGELTPDQVLPGSHRRVWWRCAQGHEWRATVKSRVEGAGCPICSNRVVIPGVNDLTTMAPELAKQWHPEKNGLLTPEQVSSGSRRKVWWQCSRGHEWQAEIQSRAAGRGCPACMGKSVVAGENDLQTHEPALARQWDTEKNGSLRPDQVSIYSNKKVWWLCERGHSWQSSVSVRTFQRAGCPYCANRKVLPGFNDLKTVEPLVAAQWHPTLNDQLEPSMVLPGSTKRVWWRCTDGHEWRAVIYSRTGAQKCGCPVCAGRTARRN
ncbi:MAG: hypothetical protein E7465_02315 [Ruminococcaceae bacterium]|nr:hypothetical protein [Oscillospiraceae bacterium]